MIPARFCLGHVVIDGRKFFQMKSKQLAEIRKDAYNIGFSLDGSVEVPEAFLKFLDVYETKKAIQEFCEQPLQSFPKDDRMNKAKEIALEAALKIIDRRPAHVTFANPGSESEEDLESERTLRIATKVYQWLIKKETNG